jgi:hypothetical protein
MLSMAGLLGYGPPPKSAVWREVGQAAGKCQAPPVLGAPRKELLMSLRLLRLAPIGALLLLSGCSSALLICPVPAILADTQSVTNFRPGTTPDLANELYTVSLVNATGDCTYSTRDGLVHSSMELSFRATRNPTSEAATYSVPYFVAVHEGAKIYSKRLYTLRFTFAPGAAVATITQAPDDVDIKISNGKLPWNYQRMAGFQMTAAQIEYNKNKSRYLP